MSITPRTPTRTVGVLAGFLVLACLATSCLTLPGKERRLIFPHSATATEQCDVPEVQLADYPVTAAADLDGDGRADELYLRGDQRRIAEGVSPYELEPAEMVAVFANGDIAHGLLDVPGSEFGEGIRQIGDPVQLIRPVGLGHDAVIINDPSQSGAYASRQAVVHVNGCVPEIIGWLSSGASVAHQFGWCITSTSEGDVIRTFQTRTTATGDFGAVTDRHLVWDGEGLNDLLPLIPADSPLCGNAFDPFIEE